MLNARWLAVTTRKKLSAELQIIVPKINTTLDTTLASPSPKPKKT
jgi:hypothetical protein